MAIMMTSHMRTSVTRRDSADAPQQPAGAGVCEPISARRWMRMQVPPDTWDFEVVQGKTL